MCLDATKEKENSLCILNKGTTSIGCPSNMVICKGVNQCFCLDNRFAFPCDDEVPCALSMCPFCVYCVGGFPCKCGCCYTIGSLSGKKVYPKWGENWMFGY